MLIIVPASSSTAPQHRLFDTGMYCAWPGAFAIARSWNRYVERGFGKGLGSRFQDHNKVVISTVEALLLVPL